jgi:hypothetical protein
LLISQSNAGKIWSAARQYLKVSGFLQGKTGRSQTERVSWLTKEAAEVLVGGVIDTTGEERPPSMVTERIFPIEEGRKKYGSQN